MAKILRVLRKRWRQVRGAWRGAAERRRARLALPRRIAELAAALDEHRRETRLLYSALALPTAQAGLARPGNPGAPATGVYTHCEPCRQNSFAVPTFAYWSDRLHCRLIYHRKLWEYVYIAQALWERDQLAEGRQGLGFGVGTESLTALFAAHGCRITATDVAPEARVAAGWAEGRQHAAGLDALRKPHILPDADFDARVAFRACDMNAIPDDLAGYDFCWSSCALEHLGSIGNGLAFIERSLDTLKPGGWAVHTTELNIGSNDITLDHADTVLFRRRDLEALGDRLAAKGHRVAPMDFDIGDGPADRYLDVPPYANEPCLKIALMGFATTSYGLIIQKAG